MSRKTSDLNFSGVTFGVTFFNVLNYCLISISFNDVRMTGGHQKIKGLGEI
jgi:hypothetical protein